MTELAKMIYDALHNPTPRLALAIGSGTLTDQQQDHVQAAMTVLRLGGRDQQKGAGQLAFELLPYMEWGN